MKLNFFVQFGIQTGIALAETVVSNAKATDEHKAAAEKFIGAAQEFLASFTS